MKKICTVLLSVILLLQPTFSLAQTYYTIEELNEKGIPHWQQTYETKWRTVDVDITPTIPDVAQMPVLTINQQFTIPDSSLLKEGWILDLHSFYVNDGFSVDNGTVYARSGEKSLFKEGGAAYPQLPFDINTNYGKKGTFTLRMVLDELLVIMDTLKMDSSEWEINSPYSVSVEETKDELALPDMYNIDIKQKLYGVSILGGARDCLKGPREREVTTLLPWMRFAFINPDRFTFICVGAKVNKVIAPDIPLCDFSAVQQTLEEEINAGRLRKIFRVNLGFVLFSDPNITRDQVVYVREDLDGITADQMPYSEVDFYAVPTWWIEGLYVESLTKEVNDYEGLDVPWLGGTEYVSLAINAQTGKLMDRTDQSSSCLHYKGVLTWDDVK